MVEPVFGRWSPTEVMERVLDGTWAEVVDGMALIEPSSIEFSGTSASISGLGSVEFEAVTSLSLNGVFSSLFDNYMLVLRHVGTAGGDSLLWRMRGSGTDISGSNYTWQTLRADSTTRDGVRLSTQTSYRVGGSTSTLRSGLVTYVYGPNLAQPTAFRSVSVEGYNNSRIYDVAGTHSLSTAYDGVTLYPNSGTLTGRVAVYGMVK